MYINPFVAGIISTVLVEVIVVIVIAFMIGNKEDK